MSASTTSTDHDTRKLDERCLRPSHRSLILGERGNACPTLAMLLLYYCRCWCVLCTSRTSRLRSQLALSRRNGNCGCCLPCLLDGLVMVQNKGKPGLPYAWLPPGIALLEVHYFIIFPTNGTQSHAEAQQHIFAVRPKAISRRNGRFRPNRPT